MTPEEFVIQVRNSVVDENMIAYKSTFASTAVKDATDSYWQRALRLHAKMEVDDENVFFDVIRQVMIDTISNVFAILDGVTQLTGQEGDFSLLANLPPEKLSGELQDRFLELEEKS